VFRTTKSDLLLEKYLNISVCLTIWCIKVFFNCMKNEIIEQNLFDKFSIRKMFNKDNKKE